MQWCEYNNVYFSALFPTVDEHYQVSEEELAHSEGYKAVCQNIWQPD